MEESSPPVPFPLYLLPPPPHIVPKQRLYQFGMEAVERDGSDPDNDAPPRLTGDYCQTPVQIPLYSYVEK